MNREEIKKRLSQLKEEEEWDLGYKKAIYFIDNVRKGWALKESYKIVFKTDNLEWMIDEVEEEIEAKNQTEKMLKEIEKHFDETPDDAILEQMKEAGFELRGQSDLEDVGEIVEGDGRLRIIHDKVENDVTLDFFDQMGGGQITLKKDGVEKVKSLLLESLRRLKNNNKEIN